MPTLPNESSATFLLSSVVEHAAVNRRVVGSSPTGGAMKKPRRKTGFFQRYKSTAWICEIRFACDIRLWRAICLRAWVDLYHITFRGSEKYHVCRKANISHRAQRYIIYSFLRRLYCSEWLKNALFSSIIILINRDLCLRGIWGMKTIIVSFRSRANGTCNREEKPCCFRLWTS